jgi:hypothetical protein
MTISAGVRIILKFSKPSNSDPKSGFNECCKITHLYKNETAKRNRRAEDSSGKNPQLAFKNCGPYSFQIASSTDLSLVSGGLSACPNLVHDPKNQPQLFDAVSFPFPASASPITGPGTKQSASSLFWPRLAKPAENLLSPHFKANVVPFAEFNAFVAVPLDLFIFELLAFDHPILLT